MFVLGAIGSYIFVCFLNQVCVVVEGGWCYFSELLKFLARSFLVSLSISEDVKALTAN